jgi:hypothetical protein
VVICFETSEGRRRHGEGVLRWRHEVLERGRCRRCVWAEAGSPSGLSRRALRDYLAGTKPAVAGT